MRWLSTAVFVVALVVGLITVVGHGLWLFFTRLFWRRTCARCGTRVAFAVDVCAACGWPVRAGVLNRLMQDLGTTARQVDRFRQSGNLDPAAYRQLMDLIAAERRRLTDPARAAIAKHPTPTGESPVVHPLSAAPVTVEAQPTGTASEVDLVELFPVAESAEQGSTHPGAAAGPAPAGAAPPARRQLSLGQPQEFLESRRPHRPFAQVLAAFMEQKNIRWGELIGALLIVAGSILLVRYVWAEIVATPFLQFFIFSSITAGIFGIGLYTERQWKLPMTSRGLLITATLIVPLNFLAMAAFFRELPATNLATLGCEVGALAGFLYLVYLGGRVTVPAWPDLLAIAVLGASAVQLLVRRFVDEGAEPGILFTLGSLPLLCYTATTAWMMRRSRSWSEIDEGQANAIFILFGSVTFAALMPFGLLLYKTHDPVESLRQLAMLFSLGGVPALAAGLMLWRRLTDPELGVLRTAGTSIAVAGALVLIAGIGLAWPHPRGMLPVAVADFAVLTAVAFWFELPAAHLLAGPCLVVAYLVGFHAWRTIGWHAGSAGQMLHALFSAPSGSALVPLVGLLGLGAELLRRSGRVSHGWFYTMATAGTGGVSLLLVTIFGFVHAGDPGGTTWVYALYSVGTFAVAWHTKRAVVSWAGSGLVLAALVQALAYRSVEGATVAKWHLALMVHSSLAVAAASLLRQIRLGAVTLGDEPVGGVRHSPDSVSASNSLRGLTPPVRHDVWASLRSLATVATDSRTLFADPLSGSALASSVAAVPLLLFASRTQSVDVISADAFWLVLVWIGISVMHRWAELFTAAQASLTLAVILAVTAWLKRHDWYATAAHPWLDPWTWQAQGIALGLLSLAWVLLRIGWARFLLPLWRRKATDGHAPEPVGRRHSAVETTERLLFPPWRTFDRVVTVALLIGLLGMCAYAAMAGAAQELSPRAAFADRPDLLQVADGSGDIVKRRVPDAAFWDIPGVPHSHALGAGSWLLMLVLLVVLVVGQWQRFDPWAVLGALAVLWTAVPLLAGRWESDVSVASALRWFLAAYLAIGSVAVWCRTALARAAAWLGWPERQSRSAGLDREASIVVFVLALTPLAAGAIYVGAAAQARSPIDPWAAATFGWLGLWFVALSAAALGLRAMGTGATWARRRDWQAVRDGVTNRATAAADPLAVTATAARGRRGIESLLLGVLAVGPLAAMTFYGVGVALKRSPIVGPDQHSFFHQIGNAGSYGVPLLIVTLTLVGYAIREWSERFAFAGGLMSNVTLTTAYVLLLARWHIRLGAVEWVKLAQFNAIATAGYGLAWLAAVWWAARRARPELRRSPPLLLSTHVALAIALNLLIVVPAAVGLFLNPDTPGDAIEQAGSPWGWLAFVLAGAAAVCLRRSHDERLDVAAVSRGLLAIGALIALSLCHWDTAIDWLGYHTLLVNTVAAAWLTLGIGCIVRRAGCAAPEIHRQSRGFPMLARLGTLLSDRDLQTAVCRWTTAVGVIALILALRAFDDPGWPWWSAGAIVSTSLLAAGLARWTMARGYLWSAGILFNLATSIWWISESWTPGWTNFAESLLELAEANIVALALPALAWMALELQVLRPARADTPYRGLPAFHHVAVCFSLVATAGVVGIGVIADVSGDPVHPAPALGWFALGSVVVLMCACLWDRAARYAVAGLYCLGLIAIGMFLDGFDLTEHMLGWLGVIVLAAYSVLTSYLWSLRDQLAGLANRLGIPRRWDSPLAGQAWLVLFNQLLVAVVIVLSYWIVLTFDEYPQRLLAAKAVLVQAFAVGMLAQGAVRSRLQQISLLVVVVGAVAWGWAWLMPGTSGNLLNRGVIVVTVLAAMTATYAIGLVKMLRRENEWTRAAQHTVPLLAGAFTTSLVFVLGAEVSAQINAGRVAMAHPAIVAVAAALIGLAATALMMAVIPGRDPLNLSERGRTAYVYAAEVLLALLCMHIRLTMPWLFHHFLSRYWPLIVWAIAFLGVGLSELFRRQQRRVLAEPLERTGALLPVLPVAGFWMVSSHVHYSLVLVLVGLLYGVLSVSRKSFGFGLLAALAANGGLGFLLHDRGVSLLLHSQLWLVPAAISVLAAAYLNRDRLTKEQMITVRYFSLMAIYVSSTVDIFSNGVGEAPLLPVLLAALSLAGILAGIMLRVRAFLMCGTVFLLVALVTMIKYAAVDRHQTWLWFVSVIVLGVCILVLFAFFEKKREEVLHLVEGLKQWER